MLRVEFGSIVVKALTYVINNRVRVLRLKTPHSAMHVVRADFSGDWVARLRDLVASSSLVHVTSGN